jgi:hypothetical protein
MYGTLFNKENEFSVANGEGDPVVTSLLNPPIKPLTSQRSMNSLNSANSPISSPKKEPIRRRLDLSSNSPSRRDLHSASPSRKEPPSTSPGSSTTLNNLQKDYTKLERQHTDLLLKNKDQNREYTQLELELSTKDDQIQEQKEKLLNLEIFIKAIKEESLKHTELLNDEVSAYKELVEDLQMKVIKLTSEINIFKRRESEAQLENQNLHENDDLHEILKISEKFNRLLKDFKVLQSNFELEKNSKLVLIDQIEFLTKENELLSTRNSGKNSEQDEENIEGDFLDSSDSNLSVIQNFTNTIHTMNELTDDDDDSILRLAISTNNDPANSDDDDYNSNILSYLADELQDNHSSPIKQVPDLDGSLDIPNNFQFPANKRNSILPTNFNVHPDLHPFPPSPDPEIRENKRQSLPSQFKASPRFETDEFVLSPFKLANQSSFFDGDNVSTVNRYCNLKPNHSRYNSHDIVPIKVEFEALDTSIRSISVPEREHQKFDVINETPEPNERVANSKTRNAVRNSAFFALNGYDNSASSNRNSVCTTTSSKRSSLIYDPPTEMSKQEIMKLKFELQSLKLHNEKLLSYIGFELQKQKKNIKKLSNKQSARTLKALTNVSKQIEYSDAKLIEKSKDMLIHKKRVLRSVSINPIVSKNYRNPIVKKRGSVSILTKGLGQEHEVFSAFNYDDSMYDAVIEDDEDDYGFMNHSDKFSTRVFSHGLNVYLNGDECGEIDGDEEESIKRHRSQIFDSRMKVDDEEQEQTTSEDTSSEDAGVLGQMRNLFAGRSNTVPKKKRTKKELQQLVDDGLKLKFLSITLGIMIIGLKLSHQNPNRL